jgi:UDP-glucose 4-epimerase
VASGGVTHPGTGFIRSHVVDGLVKERFVVRVANNLSKRLAQEPVYHARSIQS